MPQLPTVQFRGEVPRRQMPEVQPGVGAYLGAGLEKLGEVFSKIDESEYKSKAVARAAEYRALFGSAIDEEKITKPDADEFNTEASRRVDELFNEAITTEDKRVAALVKNALQDDLIRGRTTIRQETFRKKKEATTANYLNSMDQLSKSSVGADEETQKRHVKLFAILQAQLVNTGFLGRDDAVKDRLKFTKQIAADTMNLAAASQPLSFYEDFHAGKFSGNDPVDVQRALDIADKSNRARDEKVKRDTAWASREAERNYIDLAQKHQLDIRELEEVAQFYQWSDEKVDKIKQIHIGLRESSPASEKLIADALDSINKPDPSMRDIDLAAQRLINLSDKVSADSKEFRGAMDKLRALRRSVRISTEISSSKGEREQRKAQIDAKRSVTQLMNKFEPRLRPDRRKAQQGDWYDQIDSMGPAEAKNFVEQKRREYEQKTRDRDPVKLDLDQFKSLNR